MTSRSFLLLYIKTIHLNRHSNYSISNNEPPWIGFNPSGQLNTQFEGYIDALAIWKRALYTMEILQLYVYKLDSINSLYCQDDALLHYYPMDKLTGHNDQYVEDVVNHYNAFLGSSDSTTTFDPQFSQESPIIDICQVVVQCPTTNPTNIPTSAFDRLSLMKQHFLWLQVLYCWYYYCVVLY